VTSFFDFSRIFRRNQALYSLENTTNMEIVLACDLGGTNFRIAAIDREGKILSRVKAETPEDEDEIVQAIVDAAEKCLAEVKGKGEVKAFGLAVPATINAEKGIILKAPNVQGLDNFPFARAVSEKLNLPVILENDANRGGAQLSECDCCYFGNGRRRRNHH
jgi:predicted NBD/HSP70 family sugar kinase